MTEQERIRIDRINQLRQRLAEANRYADHHYDIYMRALANVARIRERLEDLLLEGRETEPGWAEHYERQKTLKEVIDE